MWKEFDVYLMPVLILVYRILEICC